MIRVGSQDSRDPNPGCGALALEPPTPGQRCTLGRKRSEGPAFGSPTGLKFPPESYRVGGARREVGIPLSLRRPLGPFGERFGGASGTSESTKNLSCGK